jgi:hypothetical protein
VTVGFHRHFIYIMGDDFIESKEPALFNEAALFQMSLYARTGTTG